MTSLQRDPYLDQAIFCISLLELELGQGIVCIKLIFGLFSFVEPIPSGLQVAFIFPCPTFPLGGTLLSLHEALFGSTSNPVAVRCLLLLLSESLLQDSMLALRVPMLIAESPKLLELFIASHLHDVGENINLLDVTAKVVPMTLLTRESFVFLL